VRVGVTGNYASGKGTVCGIFSAFGAIHIDTDIISRDITQPESPGLKKIIAAFGSEFILPSGGLDRRKLGMRVFSSPDELFKLTSILYPLILNRTIELTPDSSCIYMINAPVLFEAGFDAYMDAIIVVSSPIDLSVERGTSRDGLSHDEIMNRLNNQISLNEKIKSADYVIDNSGTLEQTRIQAEAIWNNLISSQKTRA
jgi:dephospho-CoA kinase